MERKTTNIQTDDVTTVEVAILPDNVQADTSHTDRWEMVITNQQVVHSFDHEQLDAFMEKFIEFCGGATSTRETYRRCIKSFIFWVYRTDGTFNNLSRDTIIRYREYLIKEQKAPATVSLFVNRAKQFISFLNIEGLIGNVNLSYIKTPKVERVFHKQPLSEQKAKELVEMARSTTKRNYAMVMLLLTGALRTVEVTRAMVSDLSTVMGEPVLYVQGKGHNSKDDYVRLTKETKKAIDDYLKTRDDLTTTKDVPLFAGTRARGYHKALTTRAIRGIVKALLHSIGIDDKRISTHSLRHTGVTTALRNGATFREAQQFARHKDIKTTQIYAHELDAINNKCCNLVEGALFGTNQRHLKKKNNH